MRATRFTTNVLRSACTRQFSSSSSSLNSLRSTKSLWKASGVAGIAGLVGVGLYEWSSAASPLLLEAPQPITATATLVTELDAPFPLIEVDELEEHKSKDSCWVVLDGDVWDVTAFLASHPGGEAVILKHAGGDVSTVFNPIHPPQTMQMNTDVGVKKIGVVDLKALKLASNSALETESEELKAIHCPRGAIWCIADFEMRGLGGPREAAAGGAGAWGQGDGAKTVLGKKAKAYYEAAADDWISYYDAFASYQRCRLRPRVLVDVAEIDPRTTILGSSSTLPIYVSPAAWARMGHPLGEVNITRGVAKTGITQGISATASLSVVDICAEKKALEEKGSAPVNLAYQIYVNVNHEKTKKVMQQAIEGGVNAFFVTVDSAAFGNRETDFRSQGLPGSMDDKPHTKPNVENFGGLDASLNWEDIVWLKEAAQGRPLWIKGVACVEDVELARQHGVAGVVLSNHGGRQLDHAIAPIDTLIEINERDPTLLRDLEVYIDGGVRRGTDVLKALCLGAKGVGLGRPFLFAQSAYGEDGVVRTIRILEEEIVTGMRLLGARTLKDLKPEMVQCLTGQHKTPGSDK